MAAVLKKKFFDVNMFRNTLKKSEMEHVLDALVTTFPVREFIQRISQVSAEEKVR